MIISYSKIQFMPYIYPWLLAFSFLCTNSLMAVANSTATKQHADTYPPDFAKNYLKECVQVSMAEGLEEIDAKKLCDCTLVEFQQQYTHTEFEQLNAASETDENAKNALIEVGQVCSEQILFE